MDLVSSSSDVSPTGSQMPRLVGLAYASRLYRELPELRDQGGNPRFARFSRSLISTPKVPFHVRPRRVPVFFQKRHCLLGAILLE